MVALEAETGCPTYGGGAEGVAFDPAPFVRRDAAGRMHLELVVRGAHCGACLSRIERGVRALPGILDARMNLSTRKFAAVWEGALAPIRITEAIASLGYGVAPFDAAAIASDAHSENRLLMWCLGVTAFASMNVMLLSVSIWAGLGVDMDVGTRTLFYWLSALIAIPATLYGGIPFFRSALAALRQGRANMDVPISLAVLGALALSIYEASIAGEHAYFEAPVMLLFLLLIGRWLDHNLRDRARAAARNLLAIQSLPAVRLTASGAAEAVAARDIVPGDRLLVMPGDRVVADSEVIDGDSDVDCALVTGESAPVAAAPGSRLHAGVINLSRRLVVRAVARSEDSLVAQLTRLVEAGEQTRSRYVRLADKAARVYVPVVHTLAAMVFAGWLLIDCSVHTAAVNAIAVLIITCPCALGLAVPAVQVVATGRLFRNGTLVKSGDALERIAEVTHVVFDKTGTLTLGRPVLAASSVDPEMLEQAARLARISRHPLSRALAHAAGPGLVAMDARETPGEGIEAELDGVRVRLGSASFVGAFATVPPYGKESEALSLFFAREGGAATRFTFDDVMRADVPAVVHALEARGLRVELLSGDREAPARAVAEAAGIASWKAGLLPHEKTAHLAALKAAGARTLMIGDGLNDAPALAQAHASMAPGSAVDATQSASDLVFQGDTLWPVVEAIDVARQSRKLVVENFGFSALYNAVAIPFAALGFVTPLIAAIAMSASSLVVTLNALRLNGGRKAA